MRKALVLILAAVFVLAMASVAYAADPGNDTDTPFTFIETPANTPPGAEYNANIPTAVTPAPFGSLSGASAWAYRDLSDAATKYEGSYAPFGYAAANLYDLDTTQRDKGPHGGYGTTTNKCKVCHAVHRATGAFMLLRTDNADDACSYCHIGDHRHSVVSAYWQSGGNIRPVNGHTIGAGKDIPDSSVWQWVEEKTLEGLNNQTGEMQYQTINVRRYMEKRKKIMRYIVHGGRFIRVGPMYLRCMSCHQPHNASRQIWKPYKSDGTVWADGYKLLRLNPSGSIQVEPTAINPDGTLTVGAPGTRSYSQVNSAYYDPGTTVDYRIKTIDSQYTSEGVTAGVITDMTLGAGSPNTTGYTRFRYFADGLAYSDFNDDGIRVEETSMAFWCADCHNLNIAGKDTVATNWGSGKRNYNMLSDRSHNAPMNFRVGTAMVQGSQCYSCHNNDMPYVKGAQTFTLQGVTIAFTAAQTGCGTCHINSTMYRTYKQTYRTFQGLPGGDSLSDWPHAGPDTGFKLLNSITGVGWVDDPANPGDPYDYRTPYNPGAGDGLDKICKICHGPEGTREIGVDK